MEQYNTRRKSKRRLELEVRRTRLWVIRQRQIPFFNESTVKPHTPHLLGGYELGQNTINNVFAFRLVAGKSSVITKEIIHWRVAMYLHHSWRKWVIGTNTIQDGAGGRKPGLCWLCFCHSTCCPVLLWQMETCHNWLGSWAGWWNIQIKVNSINPCFRPPAQRCIILQKWTQHDMVAFYLPVKSCLTCLIYTVWIVSQDLCIHPFLVTSRWKGDTPISYDVRVRVQFLTSEVATCSMIRSSLSVRSLSIPA